MADIGIVTEEFNTFAEKMAFRKGLTYKNDNNIDVLDIAGFHSDVTNERGKYEWSLGIQK